jgi:hypothetical protein
MVYLGPKKPIELAPDVAAISQDMRTDPIDKHHRLYFISERFISEPKTEINSRILVVGRSKTGLSFIRALLDVPFLYFNNITLLSPEGDRKQTAMSSFFYEDETYIEDRELQGAMQRPNVTLVRDRLKDFDRPTKTASTWSRSDSGQGARLHFDILVLTTSRMYKLPR